MSTFTKKLLLQETGNKEPTQTPVCFSGVVNALETIKHFVTVVMYRTKL